MGHSRKSMHGHSQHERYHQLAMTPMYVFVTDGWKSCVQVTLILLFVPDANRSAWTVNAPPPTTSPPPPPTHTHTQHPHPTTLPPHACHTDQQYRRHSRGPQFKRSCVAIPPSHDWSTIIKSYQTIGGSPSLSSVSVSLPLSAFLLYIWYTKYFLLHNNV